MLLEAIFAIGTIVLTEFVRVTATEAIRSWINSYEKSQPRNQSQNEGNPVGRSAQDITADLEVIDAEVVELERKEEQDNRLSKPDKERQQELEHLRSRKFKEFQELRSQEIIKEQSRNPDNFATTKLDKDRVHVLQFHMGQVVMEKKCRTCSRPMILQSKKRLDGSLYQLDDFFWSCVGFYNDHPFQCKGSQRFTAQDLGLLHKADIFEFQISNQELSTIFHQNSVEKATVNRLKAHLREKDDEVFCPIHHVPMVLREKREHAGVALDMFFLGCPHSGCKQLVKLKSPAQLAAYLSRKEGRGIL
ncbi:MAG: hypothetical protein NW224_11465 [Leptolyngbyaceae cyanobacterium bins.302]|nr:hypothetical protein [Leptolyngbyaceae cyanobacterium bins.302]